MIKGILFDVDGVIFDSEPFIRKAYINYYANRYAITLTDQDLALYTGTGEQTSIIGLGKTFGINYDVKEDKKGIYNEYARLIKGRLKCMNGAEKFIRSAKNAGLKLALATSADREKLNHSLSETGLETELFDFIVTGDMVKKAKPDGAIYRYAASALVLDNEECLVVEDSVAGNIAAKRAGSPSMGVSGSYSDEELLLSGADLVLKDLSKYPDFGSVEQFNEIYSSMSSDFLKKSVAGKLIESAGEAMRNSYSPYSRFKVGASVLTEKGNIYRGCNVENASFGGTICAERSAAVTAITSEGKTSFKALAVTSLTDNPAPPCAICRQFISEFAGPDTQVYLYSVASGVMKHYNFGTLMPSAFELDKEGR